MNEQTPQQSFEGCKPEIDYPCVWQYKIIGQERQAIQTALSQELGDTPYSLSASRTSKKGKYLSLNLELTVQDEEERLRLYKIFKDHPAIKLVL
jgi:putative lipoic acid-binding regulatory protein